MAILYAEGHGVKKNVAAAARLFRSAAMQGEVNAMRDLGHCYEEGEGVEKDLDKAREWYDKAAQQGHAQSQENLAALYEDGKGVAKDDVKALKLYEQSADGGNPFGKKNMEKLCPSPTIRAYIKKLEARTVLTADEDPKHGIYDVFISYRRRTGVDIAQKIQLALQARGYKVFFDFDSLRDGEFNRTIFKSIEDAPVFILVLTEGSLDLCGSPDDWVRKEICHALEMKKQIVPIKLYEEHWEWPVNLPAELSQIKNIQISDLVSRGPLFQPSISQIIQDRFPLTIKHPIECDRHL